MSTTTKTTIEDPIDWLLEEDNPSVRAFTLQKILARPADDPELIQAKQAIMGSQPVLDILKLQDKDGWWDNPKSALTPMYVSTDWQLKYLAELGASLNDAIRKGTEFVISTTQSAAGDFPVQDKMYHKFNDCDLICYDGMLTWILLRLGYTLEDERVKRAVDFLSRIVLESNLNCHFNGDLPCAWGGAHALRALSEVPEGDRSAETNAAIDRAVEFYLSQDLSKAEYPSKRGMPSKHWWKFGFPRNYQSDILQMLVILTNLGYSNDPRLGPALDFLESKRKKHGLWRVDATIDKMPVRLVKQKDPSKWITWQALYVLKEACRYEVLQDSEIPAIVSQA